MKRLSSIILAISLFMSGCGNEYLDNLDDIQTLVDGAYDRVNRFGVNLSILAIKDITDSVSYNNKYWVPEDKIVPVDREYLGTYIRNFSKNDSMFTYYVFKSDPNRYAIYQTNKSNKENYYVVYNEPLAVEGIFSVVLKSKSRFDTAAKAIEYANDNLIPKLVFKSTTTSTTVDEHVKSVSTNFEIIEIFSPSEFTTSEEAIKKIYPSLLIEDLII